MKQRILAILLSLTMMFTLVPTAMAEGSDPVAQIGETTYATLKAAFEGAKDGDTVTLLKNVETNNIEDTLEDRIIINKEITLNLNDKTITSPDNMGDNENNFTALIVDADVTINATAEGGIDTGKNGGYGICVRKGATLTINGGRYYGGGTAVQVQEGTLIINDGTFSCEPYSNPTYGYKYLINCIDSAWKNGTAKVFIKGGIFKSFDPSNSASENPNGNFLAEGYGVKKDGDNYIVTEPVAAIGDTKYPTLAAAVKAADNATTVTLLKDTTENVTIPTGKTITLDLNGKNIKPTTGNAIVNKGNLTIVGSGEVAAQNSESAAIANFPDATANVNGGTFVSAYWYVIKNLGNMTIDGPVTIKKPEGNTDTSSLIDNGWYGSTDKVAGESVSAQADKAKLTIKSGEFTGKSGSASCSVIKNDDYATLDISGGTFDSTNNQNTSNSTTILNWNVATISGGTFIGQYPLANGAYNNTADKGQFTISGGTFTGLQSVFGYGEGGNAVGQMTITDGNFSAPQLGEFAGKYELKIFGGLFSSDPSAYVPATHHVEDSFNGSYPFAVKEGAKSDATIIVTAATNAAVSDTIEPGDKAKIEAVKDKANVEGMAAAIRDDKKAAIAKAADVTDEQLAGKNMIETEITVKVEAKAADLAKGKLTFEASPVATVKVNGTATGTTVPVTNDMLNGQPITVKLPLPAGFTPKQILHKFTGGGYEYFINETEGSKRGAGSFKIEDNCAVFTIYGFSTFELSGTVTYVAPSYSSGSSSDPTYSVTVDKTENGSVTVSPKSASKGDTVTVTVKPDSGYVLETLTVTDKNGNELTLKDKGDGKYTFTMPAGKVEVKATFMEDNSMLNFFYDVPNGAYFYEAVKWAVDKGITNGLSDTMFGPYESCTRAQIVTFLWRAAGSPEPKTVSSFTDVPASAYYAKAVAWAVENGITNGMTETTFAPDATCTRGQSVTFLYRALKGTASGSTNFTDVKSDAFYADAISWAVANNVTNGTSNTTFSPNADCTRAEIVTFLYRAYQGK